MTYSYVLIGLGFHRVNVSPNVPSNAETFNISILSQVNFICININETEISNLNWLFHILTLSYTNLMV